MRKHLQKPRKEIRDPVRSLLTKIQRKLELRSIVTCPRNMGAHIPRTTHKSVIGTRKMETRNPISKQPKKGVKKTNPTKQSFVQLSEKLDKLEKAIKKRDTKRKKRRCSDTDSNSEEGIGSGSIGNLDINLRETYKKQKCTPPSPIKAIPTIAESDCHDDCLTSFSDDDDVTVTSSTKSKEIHVSNSTTGNNNPLEGKTTAIVAVMRGKPKEGNHRHHSNKLYKKNSAI